MDLAAAALEAARLDQIFDGVLENNNLVTSLGPPNNLKKVRLEERLKRRAWTMLD